MHRFRPHVTSVSTYWSIGGAQNRHRSGTLPRRTHGTTIGSLCGNFPGHVFGGAPMPASASWSRGSYVVVALAYATLFGCTQLQRGSEQPQESVPPAPAPPSPPPVSQPPTGDATATQQRGRISYYRDA